MKINEITGVKKYQDLTASELMKVISDEYGLKLLGSGSFGYVLQSKDPNVVIKVVDYDESYMSFINFVIANPNKHYPKILKQPKMLTAFYKRYDIQPNKFNVITMEKLYEMPSTFAEFAVELGKAYDLHETPPYLPTGKLNGDEYSDYAQDRPKTYAELASKYPWIPDFWEAAHQIIYSKKITGMRDLHTDNLMLRDDGTIVITDPVIGSATMKTLQSILAKPNQPMTKGPKYK